ncbi:MAG: AFG1 family ATPase [Gammaproteobacteria bacterium]|nr:AFG1 family ATPase [Gammaproteobacteria bacterium]
MKLINLYKRKVQARQIIQDPGQFEVINKLDHLAKKIEDSEKNNLRNYLNKIFHILIQQKYITKGIYLYSDVGRGKTMLMDIFYENLAVKPEAKIRLHFHIFMQKLHTELQACSGTKDPIEAIIKNKFKASGLRVLCLDEFLVHDIADAMILARVLKALIKHNIILITTSNVYPDDLYKNGLQRGLFLPAIDLLKNYLDVLYLNGQIDYRAQMLQEMACYLVPNNSKNFAKIQKNFHKLAFGLIQENNQITIFDRQIDYIANSHNVIWFDFNEICNTARSASDYLELATLYNTVIISGVYQLTDKTSNIARRFINLIDVLYDYKVNLIISSDCELDSLYSGSSLRFEFARTISRLKEMQTLGYLKAGHLNLVKCFGS